MCEIILWKSFDLSQNAAVAKTGQQFFIFLIASIIGLTINSVALALVSQHVPLSANPDFNKNLAKVAATVLSMVSDFLFYKLLVFKK